MTEKTRKDVKKLKCDWVQDPRWDLENSEGFEAYRDELAAFRYERERQRKERRAEKLKLKMRAAKSGLNVGIMEDVERLEARANDQRDGVARLLRHYFEMAGVPVGGDVASEIDSIADSMVNAAVMKTQAELLRESGQSNVKG